MQHKLKSEKDYILSCLEKEDNTVVVGAGEHGKELVLYILGNGFSVFRIFDNDPQKINTTFHGVQIVKPCRMDNDNIKYIISPCDGFLRDNLIRQLMALGIGKGAIVDYEGARYQYIAGLPETEYKDYLSEQFHEVFGYHMNWENPVTYNEKLNWEKVHVRDPLRTLLCDKYRVRE